MSSPERFVPLGFTTEMFPAAAHACYIYNDDDERRQVISRFIESGLKGDEKVGYAVDTISADEMWADLSECGIDLPSLPDERQFRITRALETYCPDGTFIPERMLRSLRSMYGEGIDEGYAGLRVSGEMSWALRGIPGSDRLIEYESYINTLVKECPITTICQYDARRFDGATLFDVLEVHPLMVVRGQMVRNPYFVAPEIFLKKRI